MNVPTYLVAQNVHEPCFTTPTILVVKLEKQYFRAKIWVDYTTINQNMEWQIESFAIETLEGVGIKRIFNIL